MCHFFMPPLQQQGSRHIVSQPGTAALPWKQSTNPTPIPHPASLKENPQKRPLQLSRSAFKKPTCCQYLFTLALLPLSLSQWAPPAFIFSLWSRRPRKPGAPLLAGAVSAKGIAVFPASKRSPRGLCGPFSPLKRSPQQDDPIAASWRLGRNGLIFLPASSWKPMGENLSKAETSLQLFDFWLGVFWKRTRRGMEVKYFKTEFWQICCSCGFLETSARVKKFTWEILQN